MSLRFRIVFSAACAALSLLAFWSYGSRVREEADAVRQEAMARYGGEVVGLVVATHTIEAGTQVGVADVTTADWLVDLVPQDSATALEDVIGLTVTEPVAKGAPLTALNFRDSMEAVPVPDGRIAVSLPVTEKTGVPREVTPGSTLVAYALGDATVRLISGDVVVLSLGGDGSSVRGDSGLSVAVWPQDVTAMLLASAQGELRLVLPADDVDMDGDPLAHTPTQVEPEATGEEDAGGEGGAGPDAVPADDDGEGHAGDDPPDDGNGNDAQAMVEEAA